MKINLLSITLAFIITVAIAEAQKYTKFNKPVIDLNAKVQVTTSKLPEVRRKLSIFPKNKAKYVVTSKPYSKVVRAYSPYNVTTKRAVTQTLTAKEAVNSKLMSNTRTPILIKPTILAPTTVSTPRRQVTRFQYTTKLPVPQIPKDVSYENSEEDYLIAPRSIIEDKLNSFDKKDFVEENGNETFKTQNLNNNSVNKPESIDLEAVETISSSKVSVVETPEHMNDNTRRREEKEKGCEESHEVNEEKQFIDAPNHEDDSEKSTEVSESIVLENNRKKRLALLDLGVFHNTVVTEKIKDDSDTASENNDRDEFIFINNNLMAPVAVKQSSNNVAMDIEASAEVATEITWLEEYKPRPKRSISVIEEENLGTTVSGFKFTGREPRVESDLVFRNINA